MAYVDSGYLRLYRFYPWEDMLNLREYMYFSLILNMIMSEYKSVNSDWYQSLK